MKQFYYLLNSNSNHQSKSIIVQIEKHQQQGILLMPDEPIEIAL